MQEKLTFDEIKAKCAGEWVLIGEPVTDQHMEVLSGTLLCHSKDRAEVYRKGLELRPQSSAILFLGKPPEGMEFLL